MNKFEWFVLWCSWRTCLWHQRTILLSFTIQFKSWSLKIWKLHFKNVGGCNLLLNVSVIVIQQWMSLYNFWFVFQGQFRDMESAQDDGGPLAVLCSARSRRGMSSLICISIHFWRLVHGLDASFIIVIQLIHENMREIATESEKESYRQGFNICLVLQIVDFIHSFIY